MKPCILVLFFVCLLLGGCTKNFFQGKIVYQYQYVNKQGKDVTASLKNDENTEQRYFINPGNYKSYNQRNELTQLYNSATNTCWYNVGMELQKTDASREYPRKFVPHQERSGERVMNYDCQKLTVDNEFGQFVYYYSSQVKVKTGPFMKHRYGNWSNYLKETRGALPLKFVVPYGNYTLVATAIEVKQMPLSEDDFVLEKVLKKK